MLDDGEGIDLMLWSMVGRMQADRYATEVRMLGLGEAIVQVSRPSAPPAKIRVPER